MSYDIRIAVTVAVPPTRVFEALTNRDDLRAWFCEDADVSPAEKRYDFWGCHTFGAPKRHEGRHALLAYDAPRSLAFEWGGIRGGGSRVTFTVEAAPEGATLHLHHELPRGRIRTESALSDFWGGALERVKAWLERGVRGYLPDYGMTPSAEVILRTEIAATPSQVFAALVEPKLVEQWLALPGKSAIEPRVGGRYDIGWGDDGGPVTIVGFEQDSTLSYTWAYKNEPGTVATWSIAEAGGGKSILTIAHRGFADASTFDPYNGGWSFFLNRVKLLVETGVGRATTMTADDFEEAAV